MTSEPVTILDGVVAKPTGASDFAVADDGTLAYLAGGSLGDDTRRAFDNLWALQFTKGDLSGGWAWLNFHYEPWEAEGSAYYGAALAARFAGGRDHVVQGAVWPAFEAEPPAELSPVLFSIGGFNRHGDVRRPDVFISANCAFTRAVRLMLSISSNVTTPANASATGPSRTATLPL